MSFFFLAFFFAESLLPFQPLLLCLMHSAADDLTTSVPLTDALTRNSSAPPGGPHFGSNSPCTELNASQMPGDSPGGMGGFGIDWYIISLLINAFQR